MLVHRFATLRRSCAVVTLGLLVSGCVTTQLPPISSTGAGFQPLPDEVQIWDDASSEEGLLLEEARIYDDPLLEDYLQQVVDHLTLPGMAANPEIRYHVTVIEEPTLNAFAYPHGSIYVHTGLLARMENEAQLATVLGHEMSHVERRHMVRYRRTLRNRQIGWTAAAIAATAILAHEHYDAIDEGRWGKALRISVLGDLLVGLGLELAFIASVNGYGRNLELEADHGAFAKLERVGYDPRQAAAVYELLQEGDGEHSDLEVFFFGSHPQLEARIDNAETWAEERSRTAAEAPSPDSAAADAESIDRRFLLGEDLFWQRLLPVIRDDAGLNIELGRLALAEEQLAKVFDPLIDDPRVHYLYARLRLAQAEGDGEDRQSLEHQAYLALRETIRLDPELYVAHRDLGLLAYDTEDFVTACIAFHHYTSMAPDADDVEDIESYLQELETADLCR